MKIPSPTGRRRARIEIIPLIDIMFFLLATFVMVSLSMVHNQAVPVRLPVAATGAAQDRKDYVAITVNEQGGYFYNKETVSLEQMAARLRELKLTQPDPRVFIAGDAHANFEAVMAALDEVRKAGITKVAIETQKSQKR